MKNSVFTKRIAIGLVLVVSLSACQTVSMPKLDFIKTAEFSEDAANIDKSYPNVNEAPDLPTDLRSRKQWDKDVRAMQALRSKSHSESPNQNVSQADDAARFEALKAKVHAYKKDDPVTGPVEGFPAYEPRR